MPIFENELILSVKFPPPLKGYCFGGTNVSRDNPGNKMRPFTSFSPFVLHKVNRDFQKQHKVV